MPSGMTRDFGATVIIQFRLAGERSVIVASRGYANDLREAARHLKTVVESTLEANRDLLAGKEAK